MLEQVRRKRILAVEGNSTLSDGLVSFFSSQPDMEVVGIAASLEEARKIFVETSPDLTIVDVDMPRNAGLLTIRELRLNRPDAVIIALVSYEWDDLALDAVALGAIAFVPKDRIMAQLPDLIRQSART
jgi:DNA-binding NarL/FixJ family response regulator